MPDGLATSGIQELGTEVLSTRASITNGLLKIIMKAVPML